MAKTNRGPGGYLEERELGVIVILSCYVKDLKKGHDFDKTTYETAKKIMDLLDLKKNMDKEKKPVQPDQYGWEKIFGISIEDIKDMKGDIECDYAANVMLDLIDNYFPPVGKGDVHTGITL